MGSSEDLMQRLAVSKKIMDKQENIRRGSDSVRKINSPMVESFDNTNAVYNLPTEMLENQSERKSEFDPTKPLNQDKIINSKLPDEIKRLMIDVPIVQQSQSSTVISNDIIEGAHRLMNLDKNKSEPTRNTITESTNENKLKTNNVGDLGKLKSMIRDVVRDTVRDVIREELKEAGMLSESTENSNESIQFKVGKHLFIGRVTKIKKLQ